MNRPSSLATLLLAATLSPLGAQSLGARIDHRLDAPGLDRLLWGVTVTDTTGKVLYERNGDRLFIPASNTKLVVTITAATLLGTSFTVTTSVYGTGPVIDGTLQGNLVLYGRGDPTFSNRCYDIDTTRAGVCDHNPASKLDTLAQALHARGIRVIAGDLIGDGSYFEPTLVHPDWENYDLGWWYAAPVSGLGFNDNAVDVHEVASDSAGRPAQITLAPDVGAFTLDNRAVLGLHSDTRTFDLFRSADGLTYLATGVLPRGIPDKTEFAAIKDPARYAALAFRRALLAAGITVRGGTRSTFDSLAFVAARLTTPLAEVRSRPLSDWLVPILNTSQNWFAEMLLKQVARQRGTNGSWSEGCRIERRFLIDSVGVDSTAFSLDDGSGLAAANLISPHAFTQLLRFVRQRPAWTAFAAGLPQSGKPGSLKDRFVRTPLEGRVRAKTGTITHVATLSGYVERPDGNTLIFSVMANHHTLSNSRIIAAIDSVVLALGKP
ncbi:MAG TPA: D-alanyl-D-alanine carboxypeptidase/D-alanyl-D-alanine-endopeptidase [Gemmatimonadales bacterium]|nr:D-alanyl-D-alanine carboxypeptidase/D-alanyl-D-alanine-endopeptidase [Gemmatimonadales bacterium]